jgi:hypothetical protein
MGVNSNPTASQQNNKDFLFQTFIDGVLTPVINLYFQISPRIFVQIHKLPKWDTMGPGRN